MQADGGIMKEEEWVYELLGISLVASKQDYLLGHINSKSTIATVKNTTDCEKSSRLEVCQLLVHR